MQDSKLQKQIILTLKQLQRDKDHETFQNITFKCEKYIAEIKIVIKVFDVY